MEVTLSLMLTFLHYSHPASCSSTSKPCQHCHLQNRSGSSIPFFCPNCSPSYQQLSPKLLCWFSCFLLVHYSLFTTVALSVQHSDHMLLCSKPVRLPPTHSKSQSACNLHKTLGDPYPGLLGYFFGPISYCSVWSSLYSGPTAYYYFSKCQTCSSLRPFALADPSTQNALHLYISMAPSFLAYRTLHRCYPICEAFCVPCI
jgi:hypothetical protein